MNICYVYFSSPIIFNFKIKLNKHHLEYYVIKILNNILFKKKNMHLINAKRFIKIQVIKLTNEHALSSRQIATYLNRVNPYKFRLSNEVSKNLF